MWIELKTKAGVSVFSVEHIAGIEPNEDGCTLILGNRSGRKEVKQSIGEVMTAIAEVRNKQAEFSLHGIMLELAALRQLVEGKVPS